MSAMQGTISFSDVAGRWHDLAERRLLYYRELYHSGRWKIYYNEERFALRMRDVIKAADTWRKLAARPRFGDDLRPAA
jgi:uncharacterized repeat protein (TIGR03809 family)